MNYSIKDKELVSKIEDNLIASNSKDPCKTVSREMGLPQEFVRKVYQVKKLGAVRAAKKIKPNLVVITEDHQTNELKVEPVESVLCEVGESKRGKRLDDDAKIRIIELFEEMVPSAKIKEEVGVSLQTVYNTLKAFYGEEQYEKLKEEMKDKRKTNNAKKGEKKVVSSKGKSRKISSKRILSKASKSSFDNLKKEINSKQEEKSEDQIAYEKIVIGSVEKEKDFNKIEEPEVDVTEFVGSDTPISKCIKESYTIFDIGRFELEQINSSNGVECVLIGGRHDSPVEKSIFRHSLSDDLIFDYIRQEDIINDFIDQECKEHKSLIVYISGLQTTLASLIKVCFNRKITLTLMHYSTESTSKKNIYVPQIVCNFESTSSYVKQLDRNHPVFLHGIKAKDIVAGKELTCICLNKKDDSKDKMKIITMIITENPNWEIFSHCAENTISNKSLKLGVSMSKITITEDSFIWGDKCAQTYSPLATK